MAEVVDAIRDVAKGGMRRVRFFDGPFWIDVGALGSGRMELIARSRVESSAWSAVAEIEEFNRHLVLLAHEVLQECRSNGWAQQEDVARLASLVGIQDER